MLKILSTIAIIALIITIAAPAYAVVYTWTPANNNLQSLAHGSYYYWVLKWDLPQGEHIVSAKLTYTKIWDWTQETDHLYTHLLDSADLPKGKKDKTNWAWAKSDTDGGTDYFAGKGLLLGDWNDPKGGSKGKYAVDLAYDIPSSYFGWLSDGQWAFGIDPDCHYYDGGVKFEITTAVPEPASLVLMGLGLIGLIGFKKRGSA